VLDASGKLVNGTRKLLQDFMQAYVARVAANAKS
jgi:hypothetical protein